MAATAMMHITFTLDDLPEIKNLVETSEAYFECRCTRGDGQCFEAGLAWERAVIALQESRVEREATK